MISLLQPKILVLIGGGAIYGAVQSVSEGSWVGTAVGVLSLLGVATVALLGRFDSEENKRRAQQRTSDLEYERGRADRAEIRATTAERSRDVWRDRYERLKGIQSNDPDREPAGEE